MRVKDVVFYLKGDESAINRVKSHLSLFCFDYVFTDNIDAVGLPNAKIATRAGELGQEIYPSILIVIDCCAIGLTLSGESILKEIDKYYILASNEGATICVPGIVIRPRIKIPDFFA